MLREDYVSFEQAKKLKELGFPQEASYNNRRFYSDKGSLRLAIHPNIVNFDYYICSSLSLVTKWLREEKSIHICLDIRDATLWYFVLVNTKTKKDMFINDIEYNTYEEALSNGINKALELIENEMETDKK